MENEDALVGDFAGMSGCQALLDAEGYGPVVFQIPPELDFGSDFVDILPPGASAADIAERKFAQQIVSKGF